MLSKNTTLRRRVAKLSYPLARWMTPSVQADPDFRQTQPVFDSASIASEWKEYQPELVSKSYSDSALVLTSLRESVWYQNESGPMLYRYVEGDCAVSITAKARKASDPVSYPDSQWQFGGIMFRDPISDGFLGAESYIFNVVGYRHDALQIETKSTRFGYSNVLPYDWDSGDAELRIERRGSEFILDARPLGSNDWQGMGQFTRPDFPAVMQMAIIAYAYSEGRGIFDLQVEFSDFEFNKA